MSIGSHRGTDASTIVTAALEHLANELATGRLAVDFPSAFRSATPTWTTLEIESLVAPRTLEALEREAARQSLTMGELTHHALIVYLADVDRASFTHGA